MGKTIGEITQEGKEMPFVYSVLKKRWPNDVFNRLEVGAIEKDNHYLLQILPQAGSIFSPIVFGVVCDLNKEEADRRLYDKVLTFAQECDEIEDKTHYSFQ